MTARARRDRDQSIGAFLDRFVCKDVVDDVMQYDAAPTVNGVIDICARAQTRDGDGYFVLGANLHVVFETVIALVHDLVDGKGGRRRLRVGPVMRCERFGDFRQPFIEL